MDMFAGTVLNQGSAGGGHVSAQPMPPILKALALKNDILRDSVDKRVICVPASQLDQSHPHGSIEFLQCHVKPGDWVVQGQQLAEVRFDSSEDNHTVETITSPHALVSIRMILVDVGQMLAEGAQLFLVDPIIGVPITASHDGVLVSKTTGATPTPIPPH